MAGYSKDIVATRNFNKENKASLGRRGDTKIRKVDGRKSHVNALEAYLIDVKGRAGEKYAKEVGAGTINPYTGMPEYWDKTHNYGQRYIQVGEGYYIWSDDKSEYINIDTSSGAYDQFNFVPVTVSEDPDNMYGYEALKDVTAEQLHSFDTKLGAEDVMYFQDIFTDEPFDFLKQEQELITGKIDPETGRPMEESLMGDKYRIPTGEAARTKYFAERGLQSAYEDTMGGLESEQATLSRTTGVGLQGATGTRDIATKKSGLATSGTIAQGYEAQKKGLLQDHATGIQDIGRQRGTALDTLTLGQDIAGSDYEASLAGANLSFDKGTYAEEQRQLDEYWTMIGLRQAVG